MVEVDPATIPRPAPAGRRPDVEFAVVHVDDDVIVVDKPAGLVVHPGAGNADGTLVNGLLARFPELAGVGDADRGRASSTASTPAAPGCSSSPAPTTPSASLIGQFAAHTRRAALRRRRVGPSRRHRTASSTRPIGRDPADPLRMAVVVDGKPARTEYQVVERYDRPGDAGPAVVPAGDRAHPPDPRPPRRHRPPAGR